MSVPASSISLAFARTLAKSRGPKCSCPPMQNVADWIAYVKIGRLRRDFEHPGVVRSPCSGVQKSKTGPPRDRFHSVAHETSRCQSFQNRGLRGVPLPHTRSFLWHMRPVLLSIGTCQSGRAVAYPGGAQIVASSCSCCDKCAHCSSDFRGGSDSICFVLLAAGFHLPLLPAPSQAELHEPLHELIRRTSEWAAHCKCKAEMWRIPPSAPAVRMVSFIGQHR
jgi:hypothetical protein